MSKTRDYFETLDREDPLADYRCLFEIPEDIIYFDGNSLGAKPRLARERINEIVNEEWGQGLIQSWNDADWFELPMKLGRKVAKIIGAKDNEVVVTDSTGINLFKALSCALQINSERSVILIESDNFPTNNYVLQGLLKLLGERYEVKTITSQNLSDTLNENVALVCLTQVHYQTGHLLDMKRITREIHDSGALVVWDLSHSAGVIDLAVSECRVDFAVGCTYKYLNCGPGSPAYIYMSEIHHDKCQQPITGWWGHEDPFRFDQAYKPAKGILQMLTGTQPILSLALAEVGLDIALSANMKLVRQKSIRLTQLFMDLINQSCSEYGLTIASPLPSEQRGSQVALRHENGYSIVAALIDEGVIGDFRAPNILRFGFAPLYIRYVDIWDAVEKLGTVLRTSKWLDDKYQKRTRVT